MTEQNFSDFITEIHFIPVWKTHTSENITTWVVAGGAGDP